MTLDQRFGGSYRPVVRKSEVRVVQSGDACRVYDPASEQIWELNGAQAAVWRDANGSHTVTQLVGALRRAGHASATEADVWMVLAAFDKAKLLKPTAGAATIAAALSRRSALTRLGAGMGAAVAFGVFGVAKAVTSAAPLAAEDASQSAPSAPPPSTVVLPAQADSTLCKDAPNSNEGANPFIHINARPEHRGVLQFDASRVQLMAARVENGGTAFLQLQIGWNGNNWKPGDTHYVDVRPLPPGFVFPEGNGKRVGLPRNQGQSGSGFGVTWNNAADPDIADSNANVMRSDPNSWNGATTLMRPATAPGQAHANGQSGLVSWDVTEDVRQGTNAWVVLLCDIRRGLVGNRRGSDDGDHSGDRDHRDDRDEGGRNGGSVAYYSREGAALVAGACGPQLVIVGGVPPPPPPPDPSDNPPESSDPEPEPSDPLPESSDPMPEPSDPMPESSDWWPESSDSWPESSDNWSDPL